MHSPKTAPQPEGRFFIFMEVSNKKRPVKEREIFCVISPI